VHRAVLGGYVADHPDRLVVVDGVIRLSKLPVGGLRVSRLLSQAGQAMSQDPRLIAFANTMRDPGTGKRVQPDIADMDPRAVGREDDWGWFEVKPMAKIRVAIEETHFYYLPLWNKAVQDARPDWVKTPGVWQPTALFVTPKHKYLFAAATVFPGAIGYLTYELEDTAKVASAVILASLSALFVQRLLAALRRLADRFQEAATAFAEFVAAWALLLVMLIVMILVAIELLLPAGAVGVGEALAVLASRIAAFSRGFAV
jgi:hypothetical protein